MKGWSRPHKKKCKDGVHFPSLICGSLRGVIKENYIVFKGIIV
jgi:hypothetical protein